MSITGAVTVAEEYQKNESIKPQDIQILMTWVDEQDYLPKITELEALVFLSGQHGDQDLAKKKIDVYYTSRTELPEFFKDRKDVNKGQIEIALFAHLELPRQFDRTMYCRLLDTDPSKLIVTEQVKLVGMVSDLWILREGSAPGYQYVVDASCLQFGHLRKVRINEIKKAIYVLQIIFHTHGIESLYQYVPKEFIPQDVGGDGPTLKELHNKMKQSLIENEHYFQEEQNKRIDENKRKK